MMRVEMDGVSPVRLVLPERLFDCLLEKPGRQPCFRITGFGDPCTGLGSGRFAECFLLYALETCLKNLSPPLPCQPLTSLSFQAFHNFRNASGIDLYGLLKNFLRFLLFPVRIQNITEIDIGHEIG